MGKKIIVKVNDYNFEQWPNVKNTEVYIGRKRISTSVTKIDVARKQPGQQIILFLFKQGNNLQIGNWQGVLYNILKRASDGKRMHIWFRDHMNHYWHGIEKKSGMYTCRRLKNKPGWIRE